MGRPAKITAILFGAFVFLGISLLLTRALVGSGTEREQVLEVLQAQAAGDTERVLELIPDCRAEPACAAAVRRRAGELQRPGAVKILRYEPSVNVALTRQAGTARVAWHTDADKRPVVQCVKVRREGPVTGSGATLVVISGPKAGTSSCP